MTLNEAILKQMASRNLISLADAIKRVDYRPEVGKTIVLWRDGNKTVSKCHNEEFDPEKGLAMAILKRVISRTKFCSFLPKKKKLTKKKSISKKKASTKKPSKKKGGK